MTDPKASVSPEILELIENAVRDLMAAFDVSRPPVPVELILQRPRPGMWREINLSELSISFLNIQQRHSPRMSVARLVARNMCRCEWGEARGLAQIANDEIAVRALARAVIVPARFVAELTITSQAPLAVSDRFEVPEDDAHQRLLELGYNRLDPQL